MWSSAVGSRSFARGARKTTFLGDDPEDLEKLGASEQLSSDNDEWHFYPNLRSKYHQLFIVFVAEAAARPPLTQNTVDQFPNEPTQEICCMQVINLSRGNGKVLESNLSSRTCSRVTKMPLAMSNPWKATFEKDAKHLVYRIIPS